MSVRDMLCSSFGRHLYRADETESEKGAPMSQREAEVCRERPRFNLMIIFSVFVF